MTASLLPEIHIAILREKDIFENLNQVLQHDGYQGRHQLPF